MILLGPLVYRANSYLFQFCCACVCLCLHLVWCTVSASPHGTFSLQITHYNRSIFNSVQLGVLIFTLLSPQFDILPLCTVLHQQSIGRPLSGHRSCSNTSQSHHQGQKEELRHPRASVFRCWWAEHHSGRRFLIYFYTIWTMLYTAPLYFLHRSWIWLLLESSTFHWLAFYQHLFYSSCKEIRTSHCVQKVISHSGLFLCLICLIHFVIKLCKGLYSGCTE